VLRAAPSNTVEQSMFAALFSEIRSMSSTPVAIPMIAIN
jgi:hypothetical protein